MIPTGAGCSPDAARAEATLRFTTQRMASAFEALYAELAAHRCQ